jgi:hypothetical protein
VLPGTVEVSATEVDSTAVDVTVKETGLDYSLENTSKEIIF